MHYVHQSQLSEISGLPQNEDLPVHFWTANVKHMIASRAGEGWSVLESSGALVGEFFATDAGFTVVEDDETEPTAFDNWRSAVRNIVRRGLKAA